MKQEAIKYLERQFELVERNKKEDSNKAFVYSFRINGCIDLLSSLQLFNSDETYELRKRVDQV